MLLFNLLKYKSIQSQCKSLFQIDRNDLASVLTKSQTSFPGNKDVWLKDLASYLNLKMERVAEPDPVFRDKPKGMDQPSVASLKQHFAYVTVLCRITLK